MGESHYHNCPTCKVEPVECFLPIGCGDCGSSICPSCLTPRKPAVRSYYICESGWICECGKTYGIRAGKHVESCEDCGRLKPAEPAPPVKDNPAEVDDSEGEEPEECPNCDQKITSDNPRREFAGDARCSSCYPTCSSCGEDLEDDGDKWDRCNSCEDYVCKKCRWWCACCEIYLCKGCAHNGGHGISQEF